MKALVLGYHTMGCVGFDALLRHGFEVAAVVTHRDDPDEEIWWESLAQRAADRGVAVHFAEDVGPPALGRLVAGYAPDFLFSFYFRQLLPAAVLELAPRGALNLHGSLLPKLRGRAPVNWALVHGEERTGVSLHYMVDKPDAGDLVDQEAVDVEPEDTAFSLYGKLETAAARLLDRALPALRDGTARAVPMDLSAGSYFGGRRPQDGLIAWDADARSIYNLVRAVTHPYPGAFTYLDGRKLAVWWALPCPGDGEPGTVLSADAEGVVVAAGRGALRLIVIQLDGQPETPACSMVRTLDLTPGRRLGSEGC